MTIDAPLAYAMGASAASFLPATTTTKSVESEKEWMAAERNVCPEGGCPAADAGQGSSALSVPMREDSPAARITPAKLGARDIKRLDCRFPSEDWKPGESDWQSKNVICRLGFRFAVSQHFCGRFQLP